MADNRKIWLDAQGRVLVDPEDRVYYSEECCCVKADWCWQKFTASCVDADGSPVYGSGGTGKSTQEHWTEPELDAWTCADEHGTRLDGAKGEWVLDSPGTAHYWLLRGSPCSGGGQEPPCDVAVEYPPDPGIPCSCTNLAWGAVSKDLPGYGYQVCFVMRSAFSSIDGSWRYVSVDSFPVFEASSIAGSPAPEGQYYAFGVSYGSRATAYVANFRQGPLNTAYSFMPRSAGGSETPEYSAWKAASSLARWQQYPASVLYSGTRLSAVGGVDGLFCSGWTYASEGQVYAMYTQSGTVSCSHLGAVDATSYASADACWELPWTALFEHDQWGSISGSIRTGNHMSLCIVREARGAYCNMQDVPVHVQTHVFPAWGGASQLLLPGNPCWHYRAYGVTDADIQSANAVNFQKALGRGTESVRLAASAGASLLKCDVYYHLYITEEWPFCTDDPARPFPFQPGDAPAVQPAQQTPACGSLTFATSVVRQGQRFPYPYYAWASSGADSTYWLHEADEDLDQDGNRQQFPALTSFNPQDRRYGHSYGHGYKVIRLGIQNYPSWYQSAKCSSALDGLLVEVPVVDFGSEACSCWSCGQLAHQLGGACCWPAHAWSACRTVNSNAYGGFASRGSLYSYWNEVPFVIHADGGFGVCSSQALSCYSLQLPAPPQSSSAYRTGFVDVGIWHQTGAGCPDQSFNMLTYTCHTSHASYLCTQGAASAWIAKDWGRSMDNSSLYGNSGSFTWEGKAWNRSVCDPQSGPWYTTAEIGHSYVSSDGAVSRRRTSLCAAGVLVYQLPAHMCGASCSDGSDLRRKIAASVVFPEMPDPDGAPDTLVLPAGATICYTRTYSAVSSADLVRTEYRSSSYSCTTHYTSGTATAVYALSLNENRMYEHTYSYGYTTVLTDPVTLGPGSYVYLVSRPVVEVTSYISSSYTERRTDSWRGVGPESLVSSTALCGPSGTTVVSVYTMGDALRIGRASNLKGSWCFSVAAVDVPWGTAYSMQGLNQETSVYYSSGIVFPEGGGYVTSTYTSRDSAASSAQAWNYSYVKVDSLTYYVDHNWMYERPDSWAGNDWNTMYPSLYHSSAPLLTTAFAPASAGATKTLNFQAAATAFTSGDDGTAQWRSWTVSGHHSAMNKYTITLPRQADGEEDI